MATNASTAAISPPEKLPARVAGGRIAWVDAARGIAILLVIFGHSAGGLIDSLPPGALIGLRHIFLGVYIFHMPVFFFLAGLFVEQRLEKGTARFVGKLLVTIVWPYFLWSFVQFSLIYALGSLVNHPEHNYWRSILALPWSPVSQFWFLYALFLIHISAMAAWRFGGARAVLGIALIVKLIALFTVSTPVLSLAAANAPYYALGMILGWKRMSLLLARASLGLRAMIVAAAVASIGLLATNADSIQPFISIESASSAAIAKVAWMPLMMPATLLGIAALMLLAESLARQPSRWARGAEFLGTMTMPIYLLHVMFIAGTRIILAKLFGIDDVAILPLLIAIGVIGPLLARQMADRFRLTTLLALH